MNKGWVGYDIEHLPELLPGAHAVLVTDDYGVGIKARKLGLELRDTLLVLSCEGSRFAFLFRKPCSEGTVAENVLRHGTGGLWIDGCRVSTADSLNGGAYAGDYREKATEWQNADRSEGKGSGFRQGIGEYAQPTGRWPSNLVLIHGPGCQLTGTREVKETGGGWNGLGGDEARQVFGKGWNPDGTNRQLGDGLETVQAWECEPGCPATELDRLSLIVRRLGDSGGASRFYPQFSNREAFLDWLGVLLGLTGFGKSAP